MKDGYLELRNWGKYQHYTDRNPPWVKLYPTIIDPRDNPDLVALPLQARFLAFTMICLAAKTHNMIPSSPGWIAAEAGMSSSAVAKALAQLRGIDFVRSSDSNGASNDTSAPIEQRTENRSRTTSSPTRPRDEIWDTLEVIFGPAPRGSQAHGRRNKAVADLRKFGATPDSVIAARKRWDRVFEGATPTDIAIATHYGRLIVGTPYATGEKPSPPCPKCEMGGGMHTADCEEAK